MTNEQKNVLLIVADDLGLMLGCYGLDAIKTPHVDQLAAEGVRFTNSFASTASCSGSRSTIYTGLHTHQNGQYGLQQGWCHFQTHDHIETTPQLFNNLGYQTGIIGKVHVGPRHVYPWEWYAPSLSRDVRKNAAEAGHFFDRAAETGRPFHLTVGLRDPHRDETRGGFGNDDDDVQDISVPDYQVNDVVIPPFISDVPELRNELVEYYKSVSRMDLGVGLLLEQLSRRGLADTTLVIFVSDNGAPFLNSKTTLYDAGVRLPLIVRRPKSTTTMNVGGVVNPNMISWVDILPTCLDWAGVTNDDPSRAPKNTRAGQSPKRVGVSFLPILDADSTLPSDQWQQQVYGSHTFHEVQNYWPTRFMRDHKYKYHRNIAWRLDFPFATDLYTSLSWEGLRNSASTGAESESGSCKTNETLVPSDTPEIMIGRRRLQSYIFRGPEELFDLVADPEEVNNLADQPECRAILGRMRAQLEDWQYQTDDVWLFRDGVSAITTRRAQDDGLRLPDRFDFDPKRPSNAVGPHWSPRNGKIPSASTMEFA
ncbi:Alkaline-phosphatase-like, core domain protein [Niveomyces insectorum RCEF 264]|uniref:Alkaline-phosphatase-like, core domain protein n=1 Tax=Niveomyces insectorum RCEF 264 TaxID=1081102 RepID=A0A167WGQ6_9HYPO|nr:Alkaline-phosphatase-like, core domain protein [Niveomyces insectorum RCEF 264]